jgi:DNA helicase-2/ATP-dependent DNA helicase PcrA
MREGVAYKIVGGVRFYERKEIKDALAYMRLVINPHDDVSLRRVINTPARGIGKGVMEAVEAISLDDAPTRQFTAALGGPGAGGDGQFVVVATGSRTAEQGVPESRDGVADRVS